MTFLVSKLTGKEVQNFLVCDERVPQQTNSVDCGIYVLNFAYLLRIKKEYKLLESFDIPEVRSRIVNELYFQHLF